MEDIGIDIDTATNTHCFYLFDFVNFLRKGIEHFIWNNSTKQKRQQLWQHCMGERVSSTKIHGICMAHHSGISMQHTIRLYMLAYYSRILNKYFSKETLDLVMCVRAHERTSARNHICILDFEFCVQYKQVLDTQVEWKCQ